MAEFNQPVMKCLIIMGIFMDTIFMIWGCELLNLAIIKSYESQERSRKYDAFHTRQLMGDYRLMMNHIIE